MRIALGCDHGGLMLKNALIPFLRSMGHTVEDFGTYTEESCDYPDFAAAAAQAVADGDCDRGIVICTTGIGVSIVANKIRGVRCALLSDLNSARMTRLHNDTNMMALGAAVVNQDLAFAIVDAWLSTRFSEEDRHQRRIDKMMSYERGLKKKRRQNKRRRHSTLIGKLTSLVLSILLILSLLITPITTYITSMADPSKIVDIVFNSGLLGGSEDPTEAPIEAPSGDPSGDPAGDPAEEPSGDSVEDPTGNGADVPAVASLEDEGTPIDDVPAEGATEESTEEPTEAPTVADGDSSTPLGVTGMLGSLQGLIGAGIIDADILNSMLDLPEGTTVDIEKVGEQLLTSEAANKLVEAYTNDIMNAATGGESTFTSETVMEIINPHIGELVDIVADALPEGVEIDRTALEDATRTALEAALPTIVDALPEPSEVVDLIADKIPFAKEALQIMSFIRSGGLRACALLLVMVFMVALCLFRIPGLRGLLCIGICGVISGLLCGGVYLALTMPTLNTILEATLGNFSVLITEFANDFAHEFACCGVIYGVCGLALILGTTVLRGFFRAIFSR